MPPSSWGLLCVLDMYRGTASVSANSEDLTAWGSAVAVADVYPLGLLVVSVLPNELVEGRGAPQNTEERTHVRGGNIYRLAPHVLAGGATAYVPIKLRRAVTTAHADGQAVGTACWL